jgi:hypothetical protein
MNKIEKFIDENSLDFSGTGSELNSNCCIIAGYALHLDMNFHDLQLQMKEGWPGWVEMDKVELERVFDYAEGANYGEWWDSEIAKSEYVF